MRMNFANTRFEVDEKDKIMNKKKDPNFRDFDMFQGQHYQQKTPGQKRHFLQLKHKTDNGNEVHRKKQFPQLKNKTHLNIFHNQ